MKALSKSEFMHLVVNDLYQKQRKKKLKTTEAESHLIENNIKINEYRRKKKL